MISEAMGHVNTSGSVIPEPVTRYTAAAMAVAALHNLSENPDALLLFCPSDHHIPDLDQFHSTIQAGIGATLSLQKHHHRAEHWIIVKGTAEVTRGEDVFLLSENQSTYIPFGEIHRLRNPGKIELEIIEVQSGVI